MIDINEQIDDINEELDLLSDIDYRSIEEAWEDVCLVLEEHNIQAPKIVEDYEEEMTFDLLWDDDNHVENHTLYMVVDESINGMIQIYTTIATNEELGILLEHDEE